VIIVILNIFITTKMTSDILEKKEYLVGITIIEGRNIIGKDSAGTSDPFLKIKVAD
jgi:Ca2+-dependent lipid-binding protein